VSCYLPLRHLATQLGSTHGAGLSHISTSRKQATEEAVATDQVEAVLATWNFSHDGPWTHWPGPLHKNPQPKLWARYDAIG
jgi:hypothetical protein